MLHHITDRRILSPPFLSLHRFPPFVQYFFSFLHSPVMFPFIFCAVPIFIMGLLSVMLRLLIWVQFPGNYRRMAADFDFPTLFTFYGVAVSPV